MSLVVLLPLKPGARVRALDLLRRGGPFDEAFVTDLEVVFFTEGGTDETIEHLKAAEWADVAAGEPRPATVAYSSIRPHLTDEAFFTSTPGPGDSEGGDLYEPEARK